MRSDARSIDPYTFGELSSYPIKQRWLIRAADLAFYLFVRFICSTVRIEVVGLENWQRVLNSGQIPIYTAWHNRIFLSTYFWRHRGIVVMSSKSFDAEYTARIIQRFGYGVARGSSTRGATRALIELVRLMKRGVPAGFTIDGPRGPRYIAKMGPLLLAKKTGNPVLPFTATATHFWELKKSWDLFQIPKPFARVRIDIAEPIFVAPEADGEILEERRIGLQRALEIINRRGEEWRACQVRKR